MTLQVVSDTIRDNRHLFITYRPYTPRNTIVGQGARNMDKKVYELLNDQINKEMYSAYLYLDMANFYTDRNLDGFAHWFEVQAAEEMEHGMKIYRYLHDNDQKVVLEAIAKPDKTYTELDDPLKAAYEHEQYVTSLIHAIYAASVEAKDYRTMQFMDWFIAEQCEEEKDAKGLVDKYQLFAKEGGFGLYHLDSEMKSRTSE